MKQTLFLFLIFVFQIVIGTNVPPTDQVGINLAPLHRYTTQWVFTDLFKHSSPFYPEGTNDGGKTWILQRQSDLDTSLKGYPALLKYSSATSFQVATAEIGSTLELHKGQFFKDGTYVLLYEGEGDFLVDGDGSISKKAAGRIEVVVVNSQGKIFIRLIKTTTTDPVKNIRFVPISFENTYLTTDVFYPDFVSKIKPFDILRFSGSWQNLILNLGDIPDWDKRRTRDWQTQSWGDWYVGEGASIDSMVDLVNSLGKDSWFSVPEKASDSYITKFAQYLYDNIPEAQKIYIQYSNDMWFGGVKYHAGNITSINNLFSAVFTGTRRKQVYFVVQVEHSEYWAHIGPTFNGDYSQVDAIALSGHFGSQVVGSNNPDMMKLKDFTVDDFIAQLKRSALQQQAIDNNVMHRIRKAGLPIIGYTVGAELRAPQWGWRWQLRGEKSQAGYVQNQTLEDYATWEEAMADKLIAVNRHPIMKDIIIDWVKRWRAIGAGVIIAKTIITPPDKLEMGYRGLLESSSQDITTAYKYLGFQGVINGEKSNLPYTSKDLPAVAKQTCSPACVWGTCIEGVCKCYQGYVGAVCGTVDQKTQPNSCTSEVGLNLAGIADWSTEWPLTDIFKMSRHWITQEADTFVWDTNKFDTIDFDENGYPKSLDNNVFVGSMMVRDLLTHYEQGTYVVLYDGDGVLNFHMDDVKKITRGVGRIELEIEPTLSGNNGIFLRIEWTNPADPVKNIRVLRPGYEKTYLEQPFHPFFLKRIQNFKTIRFMDWMHATHTEQIKWSDRPTPETRTFTIQGVAVETMVLLSNRLGTEPWFCLPPLADDNYITEFAQYVLKNLRPDLKIYVEYANEAWGSLFIGGTHSQQMGLALGLSSDPVQARFCYYGQRSREIFSIFETVFGDKSRLEFVISPQSVNEDTTKRILACGDTYKKATVIAIAPYLSYEFRKGVPNPTLDQLFNTHLPANIDLTAKKVAEHNAYAKQYNLKLITYQAGQGLVSEFDLLQTDLCIQANRDARMEGIYKSYLESIVKAGVKLIMHFGSIGKYSKYGSWSLLQYQNQDPATAPKFLAVSKYIEATASCNDRVKYSNCLNDCGTTKGVCLENGKCGCYFGNQGEDCGAEQTIDFFDCAYQCTFDQGVCTKYGKIGPQNLWKCVCNPGFTGFYCDLPVCDKNCNRNGLCTVKGCNCYDGFTGQSCEIDCGCGNNGVCDPNNSKACICDKGFVYNEVTKQCQFDCQCGNPQQTCIAPGECSCLADCGTYGRCYNGECICFAGFSGVGCEILSERINKDVLVGLNLGGVVDYTPQQQFLDYFKSSREWISQYNDQWVSSTQLVWNNQQPISLDSKGFVTKLGENQQVSSMLLRDLELHYPAGNYTLLFEGQGQLEINFDAKIIKRRKYSIDLAVTPQTVRDNGILVTIKELNVQNPLRNFRLVQNKNLFTYERQIWNSLYLKRLQRYSGFRFMDWMHTNNQELRSWSERNTPDSVSQARQPGVAIEHIVDLSNQLGSDPWITIPHLADNEYVDMIAGYLKDQLRSDLRIYVEFSNQVWNWLFDQGQWAQKEAQKLGILSGEVYSQRSVEIFRRFKNIFGPERRKSQLVFVLSTQTVSGWLSHRILSYQGAAAQADALGITGYFDCQLSDTQNAPLTVLMTIEKMLKKCNSTITEAIDYIQKQVNIAKSYNLETIFYEGGPTLLEQSAIEGGMATVGVAEKFIAMNRDPRMKDIYLHYLRKVRDTGAMDKYPFFHFSSMGKPTQYGSWGLLEYLDQDPLTAPKYLALMQFIEELSPGKFVKKGCTDQQALNFDSEAVQNDNTCRYPNVLVNSTGAQIIRKNFSLKLPEGALLTPVEIEVRQVSNSFNSSQVIEGIIYQLGPSGTQFLVPVQICINVENKNNIPYLDLHWTSDQILWQKANNTVYDSATGKVCGELMHFTLVAAFQGKAPNTTTDQKFNQENVSNSHFLPIELLFTFSLFTYLILF